MRTKTKKAGSLIRPFFITYLIQCSILEFFFDTHQHLFPSYLKSFLLMMILIHSEENQFSLVISSSFSQSFPLPNLLFCGTTRSRTEYCWVQANCFSLLNYGPIIIMDPTLTKCRFGCQPSIWWSRWESNSPLSPCKGETPALVHAAPFYFISSPHSWQRLCFSLHSEHTSSHGICGVTISQPHCLQSPLENACSTIFPSLHFSRIMLSQRESNPCSHPSRWCSSTKLSPKVSVYSWLPSTLFFT